MHLPAFSRFPTRFSIQPDKKSSSPKSSERPIHNSDFTEDAGDLVQAKSKGEITTTCMLSREAPNRNWLTAGADHS